MKQCVCGKAFRVWTQHGGRERKYCSERCQYRASRLRRFGPAIKLPTRAMGAANELRVAADLIMRGYEVFHALNPASPCDLAVLDPSGKLLRVEVKSARGAGNTKPERYDLLALVYADKIEYRPALSQIDSTEAIR